MQGGQGNNMQLMSAGGGGMPAFQENNNYHFRFKISLVGDSGVGKSTFLDAISQTLGTVVENEESSELHIKVGLMFLIKFFLVSSTFCHVTVQFLFF